MLSKLNISKVRCTMRREGGGEGGHRPVQDGLSGGGWWGGGWGVEWRWKIKVNESLSLSLPMKLKLYSQQTLREQAGHHLRNQH